MKTLIVLAFALGIVVILEILYSLWFLDIHAAVEFNKVVFTTFIVMIASFLGAIVAQFVALK